MELTLIFAAQCINLLPADEIKDAAAINHALPGIDTFDRIIASLSGFGAE